MVVTGQDRTADRPFFKPDISPVGTDRASVMRCRRLLALAVVAAVAVTVAVNSPLAVG